MPLLDSPNCGFNIGTLMFPNLILYPSVKTRPWVCLINDLPDNLRSSVRVLYRNIFSLRDCKILHDDLDSLARWEADLQMKFSVSKCHSMRSTRHLPNNQIV